MSGKQDSMKASALITLTIVFAFNMIGTTTGQSSNPSDQELRQKIQQSNVKGNVEHLPTWMRSDLGIQTNSGQPIQRTGSSDKTNVTNVGYRKNRQPVARQQDIPNVINTSRRNVSNQDLSGIRPGDQTPRLDSPLVLPGGQGDPVPNPGQLGSAPRFDQNEPIAPSKMVDVDYSGWREAGEGFENNRLGSTLRANWVMLDRSGRLEGNLLNFEPVEGIRGGMQVHLLKRGSLLSTVDVESNGSFVFKGVKQGAYTIVGFGPTGFFAFGFDAVRYQAGGQAPTAISVMAMPAPADFSAAWIKRFGPLVRFRNYGVFESGQTIDDPKRLFGLEGISSFFPRSVAATSITSHTVVALNDGRLVGRIHQIDSLNGRPVDIQNTTVALTQGTEVIQYTTADNFGVFEFTNIPSGDYGLMAAGNDGIGAIGITVAGFGDPGAPVIDFALANSESIGWINHYLTEEDYLNRILAPRNEQRRCNCNTYNVDELLARSKDRYKYGCPTDNEEFHNRCQGRGGCQGGCNGSCGQQGTCNSCGQAGCNGNCGFSTDCQNGSCGQPNCTTCQQNYRNDRLGAAFRRCEDCDKQGQAQGQCTTCQQNKGTCPNCGQAPGKCNCGGR